MDFISKDIAMSEATPAHPTGAGEAISGFLQKMEIASLPEPALSAAKGSLAMTGVKSPGLSAWMTILS